MLLVKAEFLGPSHAASHSATDLQQRGQLPQYHSLDVSISFEELLLIAY